MRTSAGRDRPKVSKQPAPLFPYSAAQLGCPSWRNSWDQLNLTGSNQKILKVQASELYFEARLEVIPPNSSTYGCFWEKDELLDGVGHSQQPDGPKS